MCVMPNRGRRNVAALTAFLDKHMARKQNRTEGEADSYLTNFVFIDARRCLLDSDQEM